MISYYSATHQARDNGDDGFDVLRLLPEDRDDRRYVINAELNHCRLAMVAFVGILVQVRMFGRETICESITLTVHRRFSAVTVEYIAPC